MNKNNTLLYNKLKFGKTIGLDILSILIKLYLKIYHKRDIKLSSYPNTLDLFM